MASGNDDDKAAAWGEQFDERNDAPAAGVNKEMLRQALRVNPALRQAGTSEDLINLLKGAENKRHNEPAGNQSSAQRSIIGGGNIAVVVAEHRERYNADKRALQEQIAKLQRQLVENGPRELEQLLEVFSQVDPNLTSPMTQEVLKTEARFLSEVQFTPKKLMERQLKKRGIK